MSTPTATSSAALPMPARSGLAYLLLLIVMLTWAGNAIFGRLASGDVPPFMLALSRWCGALLLMSPLVVAPVKRDWPVLRAHWRIVLALGLFGIACFNGFLYLGLHHTTASNAILMQAATPPMILIANLVLFRQKASTLQIIGVTLSTFGVVLVVVRADLGVLLGLHFALGDVMVLCGVVGWAIYTALLRVRPPVDPRSLLAATFAVGALAMLPLAIGEWVQGQRIIWHPITFATFAYVAIFPSLIGYYLYNKGVGMIGGARAGQTITLMPIFGAFLAAGLLGEPLRGYHFAGMALILAGIALSALSAPRPVAGGVAPVPKSHGMR